MYIATISIVNSHVQNCARLISTYSIVVPKVTNSFTSMHFTLHQPFAHTNCFCPSFCITLEHTSRTSCFTLATFKHYTLQYIIHIKKKIPEEHIPKQIALERLVTMELLSFLSV